MAENNVNRKLAAILSADVVGYSRLMQDDEAATVTTLKAYRTLISEIAGRHKGRVVNAPGDSILAEFASAVEAVQAAIDIQRAVAQRNAQLAEHRRMQFRIGVNLGDVIEEDDGTLYGDGVNIAARMEALANTGGIVVSGTVQEHVRGRLDADFADIGRQAVKNIAQPVQAYRIVADGIAATAATSTPARRATRWPALAAAAIVVVTLAGAGVWWFGLRGPAPVTETASVERMAFPLPEQPSIAVLPFDNLSGDTGHDYLADGLTENIIATLSQLPDLFVVASNSTFTYKGQSVTVQQVAEELGVRYVVDGSIQTDGARIRVTAQLIDALSGAHRWADRYDREMVDIFAVQDELTLNIVAALEGEVASGPIALKWRGGTKDLQAWRSFQRGMDYVWRFGEQNIVTAKQAFEEALARDPDYAAAWAGLGTAYLFDYRFAWPSAPADSFDRFANAADRAVALDADYAYGHLLAAWVHLMRGDYDNALAVSAKGARIAPNDPIITSIRAWILTFCGQPEEALHVQQEALRRIPRTFNFMLQSTADAEFALGSYAKAIEAAAQRLEQLGDADIRPLIILIASHQALGQSDPAAGYVERLLIRQPDLTLATYRPTIDKLWPFADAAIRERLINLLDAAGVPARAAAETERPSIAVLPFDNLSGDPAQDYFVDGLTEEIISTLASFRDLAVIARNSTFRYKDQAIDVRTVGDELGATYMVEGSVRRAGDAIRVTAQLVDTTNGAHLWSETYDRALTVENVFAIQDQISTAIANTLAGMYGVLRQVGLDKAKRKPPSDLNSYDCVMLALEHWRKLSLATHRTARNCLEQAVKDEPDYAVAWFHLGSLYLEQYKFGYDPRPDALDRSFDAARQAIRLDPDNAEFHWGLAQKHFFRGERDAFKAEVDNLLAGTPIGSAVRATAGLFLCYAGEWEQGLALIEETKPYDPYHPSWYDFGLFYDHFRKGRYDDALATAQKSLMQDFAMSQAMVIAAYGQLDRARDAQPYLQRLLDLDPEFDQTAYEYWWMRFRYQQDLFDQFMDGLRKAGLNVEVTGEAALD